MKITFGLSVVIFVISLLFAFTSSPVSSGKGFNWGINDSINDDSLRFPFPDYSGTPSLVNNSSPLYLNNPSNIKREVKYDPTTGNFVFYDKIGDFNYRNPSQMSFTDYLKYSSRKSELEYWKARNAVESASSSGSVNPLENFINPSIEIPGRAFDMIFGSNTISVKPQGNAELIFGINIAKNYNDALPETQRKNITFDFDEKIKMGVNGKIGDKMNLGINYDTEATFDFENNVKLAYEGKEDDILQKLEAGNVSLPLTGSLITGSYSLFGLKTELKFGNLTVTSVASQQKSEMKTIEIEGGAMTTPFEFKADDYESGKHYFLSYYFRERYDEALENLPVINSGVTITKVEVWITNRSGNFESSRNILGFSDLGEPAKYLYSDNFLSLSSSNGLPSNDENNLYQKVGSLPGIRNINNAGNLLAGLTNFNAGIDYEKVQNARLLSSSEYTFHPNLGYISLNSSLNNDEVLAVAYEYKAGGKVYRVGEFSTESQSDVLFLKLLKTTTLSTDLPTWDLMMKNVYSIDAYQVNPEDFVLGIYYNDDKTGSQIDYLTAGAINGERLLQVFNLDNLNKNNEQGRDGFFDFIDKVTINATNGRIYFPVIEPFGQHLRMAITGGDTLNPELNREAEKYMFEELYTKTQSQAAQIAEKNKFIIRGEYRSAGGAEISLNALNIPEGSVTVTAGGRQLTENSDYTVDYNLGRVTILNHSLLESGTPIQISLESNSMFSIGTKALVGTHLDYRINDNFNIGGTVLHLSQKPLTSKVSIGNEPIANTIWGTDVNFSREVPLLTKIVDKIPLIDTKEMSTIEFSGEFAQLVPGYPKIIGEEGYTHIDDFESTKTTLDLKNPGAWHLASTPQGQTRFPEGDLRNDVASGFNRARLAWYTVNSDFQQSTSSLPDYITVDDQSDHRVRLVMEQELFPNREPVAGYPPLLSILNLGFYPSEKGPYNFDAEGKTGISAGINADGSLKDPQTRWGGIMRDLITNDFEEANIEFVEFWLMDPFIYDETNSGGELYLNFGNISEDILRDSRQAFENGLSATAEVKDVDSTSWGRVPLLPRITDGFANEPQEARYRQDAGIDGLRSDDEVTFFDDYLQKVRAISTTAYEKALADPSNDDYLFFKDPSYDDAQAGILERYKRYNNMEGNSSTSEDATTITAGQLLPDMEDINRDYTLSEIEAYFQYKVRIAPGEMQIGKNFITDIHEASVDLRNGDEDVPVKWYHYKIPLSDYEQKVGQIQDFKSIRFMRLFMNGWNDEVVLRFAEINLVKSEWRKYTSSLLEGGEGVGTPQITDAQLDISAVNIEENASKSPVNYVLPPDVTREISPDNPTLRQLNEQSIVLKVTDLDDGDSRAAYKNVNIDVRQFKKLQMYIHAEAIETEILNDNDVCAFIRIGSDYKENYYEYEIPLKVTPPGLYDGGSGDNSPDREIVWYPDNMLDIEFEILQAVKQNRNTAMREAGSTLQLTALYSEEDPQTGRRTSIIGNPNLSNVRTIMIGIRNRSKDNNLLDDDGMKKSAEVWMNELRLAGFNQDGGWAAQGRMTARLADFSTIALAGNISTPGFGSIEKSVSERQQSTDYGYDFSSNFELGKFFPKKYGVRLPLYVSRSEMFSDPQYNPVDPDILLRTTLENPNLTQAERDEILKISQDYVSRKSINLTNIKIAGNSEKKEEKENDVPTRIGDNRKGRPGASGRSGAMRTPSKPFYHVSNWTAGVGYNEVFMQNINTDHNLLKEHSVMLAYNYNANPKNISPFSRTKSKLLRSKPLKLVKDFNFYYMPSMISVRSDMQRSFHEVQMRNIEQPTVLLDTTFDKSFTWNRNYDVRYNLTKALKFTYSAQNGAWIDEPYGRIDKEADYWQQKRDTVWNNVKDFGRTTQFSQRISGTWTVPINKLPLLDWTSANAQYDADFFWDQGVQFADDSERDLGNNIRNAQNMRLTTQFNMFKLYTKVPYLKKVDSKFKGRGGSAKKEYKTVTYDEKDLRLKKDKAKKITHNLKTEDVTVKVMDADNKEIKGKTEILNENKIVFTPEEDVKNATMTVEGKREKKDNPFTIAADYTLYALMAVRNVSVNFSQTGGTLVPGYLLSSNIFGFDDTWTAPGINFLLGEQNQDFGRYAADNNWLTGDSLLNSPLVMNSTISYDVRATVEPLKGLRIDLTADRNIGENRSEYWVNRGEGFVAESQQYTGNFSMSYLTLRTAFENFDDTTYGSSTYNQFLENRIIIAERLANERQQNFPGYDPYEVLELDSAYADLAEGYPNGYNSVSQDVLIPAFLAAYSGSDANGIFTGTFPKIPLPNWRIKYDGLTYFKAVKKVFKKIILNHGYNSKFQVGSYESSLYFDFDEFNDYGFSSARKEDDQNFFPRYYSDGISIDEKFVPLIGVDVTLKNDMSFGFDYKRSRRLDLSFENNRLMESIGEDYTVSFGHKIPELPLPFFVGGKQLKSDLNLRADLSVMRKMSIIRSITQETNQLIVPSNRSFGLKVYADYDINNKVTVKLFYEQDIRNPLISAEGYKTSNTKVGFSIRFKLM